MAMTATSGATGRMRRLAAGKRHLSRAPATTGTMTTCTVSSRRSAVGTSTRRPARAAVSAGVMTTASSVEPAVMVTDSATSARARNAMTFEAVPPGQQETRMRPAARGAGRSNRTPSPHPRAGINVYWSAMPGSTRRRSREMRPKSSKPSVMPMLSMMMPRPSGMSGPLNHVNSSGRTSASPVAASTHSGNALVSAASSFKAGRLYTEGEVGPWRFNLICCRAGPR